MNRTHNWIGSLREIFWLFWIVCSNCSGSDRVLLDLTESDLCNWLMNLCWSLLKDKVFPHISLVHRHILYIILTPSFGAGALRFTITRSDQFICHQLYTISNIYIYGRGTLSFFLCPQLVFPSSKIYYIRYINFYFNEFYNNGDILPLYTWIGIVSAYFYQHYCIPLEKSKI